MVGIDVLPVTKPVPNLPGIAEGPGPVAYYGQHMDFSPKGKFAAVLKNNDSVLVWEQASGATRTLSLGGGGSGSYERVCWSTNEHVLYLLGSAITRVTLEPGLSAPDPESRLRSISPGSLARTARFGAALRPVPANGDRGIAGVLP